MSKVFNMVGGGGGKNISSIIITGLESTDTITCTKDSKSYTAMWDSTAQHWEIVGLPLGTFTVTATNGTNTKTETVLIDIVGVYEIEMFYHIKIYWDGDAYQPLTAFDLYDARHGTPSVSTSFGSDCVMVKQNLANTTSGICSANPIDLSQYSKLSIEWSKTSAINTSYSNIRADLYGQNYSGINIYVDSSGKPVDNTVATIGISEEYSDDYTGTHHITEFDLSGFTQTGYLSCSFWYTSDAKIHKVWLE